MATCGDCKFFQVDMADPRMGVCAEAGSASAGESASGVASMTLKGKRVKRAAEACERFQSRKSQSREERLRGNY